MNMVCPILAGPHQVHDSTGLDTKFQTLGPGPRNPGSFQMGRRVFRTMNGRNQRNLFQIKRTAGDLGDRWARHC